MKKGFTLVELVAVLAIITVLSLILIPKVITIVADNKREMYIELENRIENASLEYITDNYYNSTVSSIIVNITDLVNNGLINEVVDVTDKTVCTGYVLVENLNAVPVPTGYLNCTHYITEGFGETNEGQED